MLLKHQKCLVNYVESDYPNKVLPKNSVHAFFITLCNHLSYYTGINLNTQIKCQIQGSIQQFWRGVACTNMMMYSYCSLEQMSSRVILIHLGVDLGRIAKKEVSHSHSQMKITYLKLNPKVWSYQEGYQSATDCSESFTIYSSLSGNINETLMKLSTSLSTNMNRKASKTFVKFDHRCF